jgi:hypothetical protein
MQVRRQRNCRLHFTLKARGSVNIDTAGIADSEAGPLQEGRTLLALPQKSNARNALNPTFDQS